MEKYIGGAPQNSQGNLSDSKPSSVTPTSGWTKIGYLTVAFLALANPIVMSLLSKLPYVGGNSITEFLVSVVLFVIAAIFIEFYA